MTIPKAKQLIKTLQKKPIAESQEPEAKKANHILQIWKIIQNGIGEGLRS